MTSISEFMTAAPHGIDPHEPLQVAVERMRSLNVRHLPVRAGGKPVGLLSQRDIELLGNFEDIDFAHTKVGEVMTEDPFTVEPNRPLREVAATMAERKIGSCLIVDDKGTLVGIFTDTDALKFVAAKA